MVELVHEIQGMLLKRLKATFLKMQGHLFSMYNSVVLALPNLRSPWRIVVLGVRRLFCSGNCRTYLIIVTDATDAVSVNFSGRCKFILI